MKARIRKNHRREIKKKRWVRARWAVVAGFQGIDQETGKRDHSWPWRGRTLPLFAIAVALKREGVARYILMWMVYTPPIPNMGAERQTDRKKISFERDAGDGKALAPRFLQNPLCGVRQKIWTCRFWCGQLLVKEAETLVTHEDR